MMVERKPKRQKVKSIWISDVHLGTSFSKAVELLEFLDYYRSEQIILVGDIIDIWGMKSSWNWTADHSRVIQKLIKLSQKGVRIIYIPGNHDELFKDYINLKFGDIEIKDRIDYLTNSGQRLLVVHGDDYDIFMQDSYRWLAHLGDQTFHLIQFISRQTQYVRNWFGRDYWSLAGYMKHRTKSIGRIIGRFEQALIGAARAEGYDGVICGHIHKAEIKLIDGIVYMNCGDWVDACTALVEDLSGNFVTIDWLKGHTHVEKQPITLKTHQLKESNHV
ncbi:MAG: UDP-2,3-diacylglucosamine diphosphatase [Candidatus Marinimicrobia bacterium]|nr:UDP-2,3-diacylglucosamine diphosphatase [Candidatus Neomarinimicrobiota bacterium]MCF7922603.1 UDP-2,3-diacylglucosamine diphosphatase [Candidatus Neomarinimicrobiota bacterium]